MVKADDERPGGDGPPLSVRSGPERPTIPCPPSSATTSASAVSSIEARVIQQPCELEHVFVSYSNAGDVHRGEATQGVAPANQHPPATSCIPACGSRRCDATGVALEGWPTTGDSGENFVFLGVNKRPPRSSPLAGRQGAGSTTVADVRPLPPRRGSRRAGSSPGAGRRPRHGAR
jgi:hypothetical protein